jgi:hypothetical protein
MELVDVEVSDLQREPASVPGSYSAHVVVLRESQDPRALPIFVGELEGRPWPPL